MPARIDTDQPGPASSTRKSPSSFVTSCVRMYSMTTSSVTFPELATQHRSTLVFVNTRRLAERLAHHLGERLGKDAVAAHHGSLSRKLRLAAEKKLKAGEIRALVATASLELGIDIGSVDLVCQIDSQNRQIQVTQSPECSAPRKRKSQTR